MTKQNEAVRLQHEAVDAFMDWWSEEGLCDPYAEEDEIRQRLRALASPPVVKDWPDCCTHDNPHHGPVPVGGVHWSDGTDLPA